MLSKAVHTKGFKWLLAVIIITIFLVSYAGAGKLYIKKTTTHGNAVNEKENLDYQNVSITYEKTMPEDILEQCRLVIEKLPGGAVKQFVDDDYKIILTSDISLPDPVNHEVAVDNGESAIGYMDYKGKTITVLCNSRQPNVTIPLAHELCHYCDIYFGSLYFADQKYYEYPQKVFSVSYTDIFNGLYGQYKDTYVEFEKDGVGKTEENRIDFDYPVSSPEEFFACSYKDFLIHPEYVKQHYMDLFTFYQRLEEGNLGLM